MSTRKVIENLLRASPAPGRTAAALAAQLGKTESAVHSHIKFLRAAGHQVHAVPGILDKRGKSYYITGPAPAARQPARRPGAGAEGNLSNAQMEAAIRAALKEHATEAYPIHMTMLAALIGQPLAMVRPSLTTLIQAGGVLRKGGNKPMYCLPPLVKPAAAPTEPTSVAGPRVVNVMHQPLYVPHELRAFDGRDGAMDAYRLPSRGMAV